MADQFESSRPHSTRGSSYMEEKKKKEIDTQNAHSEELFMISQMLLTLTRLNHGSCDRSAGISHPNRCQMSNKHQCHEQNRSLKLDEQECLNTSTLQERDEEYKCITSTITKHFFSSSLQELLRVLVTPAKAKLCPYLTGIPPHL